MPTINKSALVFHSKSQMYELVKNAGDYEGFLPWCSKSEVLSESSEHICAALTVSRMGLTQTFSTCNELHPPNRIVIDLKEGPFSELSGEWTFTELRKDACKIEVSLTFNFSGRIINTAFGTVFHQIANTMVDSFCKRADEVYVNE